MASIVTPTSDNLELGSGYRKAFSVSLFVGGGAFLLAILLAFLQDSTFRRFYFAYTVSYAFFLSISLGGLFFVLIQHVTRAGWSVGVRRLAETIGAMLVLMCALAAPIVVSVFENQGKLYRWAQPVSNVEHEGGAHGDPSHAGTAGAHESAPNEHMEPAASPTSQSVSLTRAAESGEPVAPETTPDHEGGYKESGAVQPLNHLILEKRPYLNPIFFLVRLVIYFTVWGGAAAWYWLRSVEQDVTGNSNISLRLQGLAAPMLVALGLTLTLGSIDLFMSLDPTWFSTMYGVYYFAGCAVSIHAVLIILVYLLQKTGYLNRTVTIEHYHDLGKFLFGFTFFWGYIAFSQYMLLWYSNIPEEIGWYARRGATTVHGDINGWTTVSLLLLFGHLLIPFAGLLSRHVKRAKELLLFWAIWMLVFHWLDMLWLVMPEYDGRFHLGVQEILCLIGIGGLYVAGLLRIGLRHSLRPVMDPRLPESLTFQNI
jgi:hypothetical protein